MLCASKCHRFSRGTALDAALEGHCRVLTQALDLFIHSFIHSGYFNSASSSPLLLRGAPGTARILCRSFALKSRAHATASKGLAQGPYVAARFEPTTLQSTAIDSTSEHPLPTFVLAALAEFGFILGYPRIANIHSGTWRRTLG